MLDVGCWQNQLAGRSAADFNTSKIQHPTSVFHGAVISTGSDCPLSFANRSTADTHSDIAYPIPASYRCTGRILNVGDLFQLAVAQGA